MNFNETQIRMCATVLLIDTISEVKPDFSCARGETS